MCQTKSVNHAIYTPLQDRIHFMSFISSKEKEPCGSESNWKHLPLKQTLPHIIMKPGELQLL